MYCPKCGHQANRDGTRFCPGCGFRLDGVIELLARDGVPTAGPPVLPTSPLSPRHRGIRNGMKLVFFSVVLLPFAFGLSFPADSPAPLLLPFTVFLAGLARALYSWLFGEDAPAYQPPHPAHLPAASRPALAPPSSGVPVSGFAPRRVNTADMAEPRSVTEHTTQLLEEDN